MNPNQHPERPARDQLHHGNAAPEKHQDEKKSAWERNDFLLILCKANLCPFTPKNIVMIIPRKGFSDCMKMFASFYRTINVREINVYFVTK